MNVVNLDGTVRHGKFPPKKVLKMIYKKYGIKIAEGVCRKAPVIAIPLFLYDWSNGGLVHAFNNLVWPVSELWSQ